MSIITLPYGRGNLDIDIPDFNLAGILRVEEPPVKHPDPAALMASPEGPFGVSLDLAIDQGCRLGDFVVMLPDISRPCPWNHILPPLMEKLSRHSQARKTGFRFVIGNGTHRAMTDDEIRAVYGLPPELFVNHDCRATDLVDMGPLSTGNRLLVNRIVVEAGFRIVIGIVNTHYFAGFSGGRKMILPGVAGAETIRKNHSLIQDPRADIGRIDDNPISLEMEEAADRVGVHYNVSLVLNSHNELYDPFWGGMNASWRKAVEIVRNQYSVSVPQAADVVVVTPNGFPKDRTFYHAQHPVNNVMSIVKPGGTIVLVSRCEEGVGSPPMEDGLKSVSDVRELLGTDPAHITVGGHRAVATAKILSQVSVIVISDLPRPVVEGMHFRYARNWEDAWRQVLVKHGTDFLTWVVANGSQFFAKPLFDVPLT